MLRLRKMLKEGESIYKIQQLNGGNIYVIGTTVNDICRELDISGCIEETLHSLLDEGYSDEVIEELLNADKLQSGDEYDENDDYYIDKDYVIEGFAPVHIEKVEDYRRPIDTYVVYGKQEYPLCKHFEIPEDPTDDEVLELMKERFAIDPDEYIVYDLFDDGGSVYGIQSTDRKNMFILKRK